MNVLIRSIPACHGLRNRLLNRPCQLVVSSTSQISSFAKMKFESESHGLPKSVAASTLRSINSSSIIIRPSVTKSPSGSPFRSWTPCVTKCRIMTSDLLPCHTSAAFFHSSVTLYRKKGQHRSSDEATDSDEEEMEYDSDSDNDPYEEEDREFNPKYKDIKAAVKSLRLDSVAGSGLNVSRNKIDEFFLDSKLRLNGERVLKKGKKLEPGDYVDVISEKTDSMMKVKRVRLLSVSSEKTQKDKFFVKIRTWRQNTSIGIED